MSITGSNNPFACEPVVFANANSIVSLGTITRDGNQFTFSVGFVWKINGVTYQNTAPVVITISEATVGFNRIDNALLNTANGIELQQGLESETIALRPTYPENNILLTSWNISGETISDSDDPIVGSQVVKKAESNSYSVGQSGTNVAIELPANGASILFLKNALLESVSGFSLANITGVTGAEAPYPGKSFFLANYTGSSVTLNHDDTAEIPFFFVSEANIIMPNNGIIELRYNTDGCWDLFKSWTDIDLSTKADLVGGKVPSSQLPAYVDDVLEFANLAAFPVTGETGKIYIALDVNKQYRWSGSIYIQITNGLIASTNDVPEGTNLYWTVARGLGLVLSGLSAASGTFTSSDTLLTALGKIKYLIDNIATTYQAVLTDTILGTFLLSLTAKNTPIDADTISYVNSVDGKSVKTTLSNWFTNFIRPKTDLLYASKFRIGSTVDTSAVTGTTTITLVMTPVLIPANTFVTGDAFTFRVRLRRTVSTSSNSTVYFYTANNSSVTVITDPTLNQLSYYTANLTNTLVQGKTEVIVNNNTTATTIVNYTNSDDDIIGNDFRSRTINWTVDNWVYLFIGNGQTTTSAYVSFWELFKK